MVIVCPEYFKMWKERELRYCDHLNPIQWSVIERPTVLRVLRVDRQILRVDIRVLRVDKRVLRMGKQVLQVGEDCYEWPGK